MEPTELPPIRSRVAVDYAITATKSNFASLTSNADQKANIIIAITSLIFTISIGQIGELDQGYQISLIILMLFSLISLLLAIISVTPNYRQRSKSFENLSKEQVNLFFFGHFSEMSFEDFYVEMAKTMNDDDLLYNGLLKDIYQMGKVLHKEKFKILFLSYRFFFVGLLLSCLITFYEVIANMAF